MTTAQRSLQDIDRDLLAVSARYELACQRGLDQLAAEYSDDMDELLDERTAAQRTQDA